MSLLGVDIGTSSCKAIVINSDGDVLAQSGAGYLRTSPRPGWSEIVPEELMKAVEYVIREAAMRVERDPVTAMSFSVFGGSFVPLDSRGNPLYNIVSTTDRRAVEVAERWAREFTAERTYRITGLAPHPSFMLLKAIAFRRNHPDLFSRTARLATAREFVLASLGLPAVADRSSASTYMAYDLDQGGWSKEILNAAAIEPDIWPDVVDSGAPIGELGQDVAERLGLRPGTLVVAGGHDQQVAALGAGLTCPGMAVDSMGTVEAISTLLTSPRLDGSFAKWSLPNWLHVHGERFFTIVYSFSCADLLNWAGRAFFGAAQGAESASLQAVLAAIPDVSTGVLVLPHFSGSGTPHMDPASRGAIVGLDATTTRESILRGIVDCQNYEMRVNLDLWRAAGIQVDRLRVYGGPSKSDALLQIKADILGIEVARLETVESGCFGAAVLAGFGSGAIPDVQGFLRNAVHESTVFQPRPDSAAVHNERYGIYRGLYAAVRDTNHSLAGMSGRGG
jgi:xylulokinase